MSKTIDHRKRASAPVKFRDRFQYLIDYFRGRGDDAEARRVQKKAPRLVWNSKNGPYKKNG